MTYSTGRAPFARLSIAALAVCGLAACATSSDRDDRFMGDDTRDMEQAVATPINDLGFDDIEIPAYLTQMTNPYATSPEMCRVITSEIAQLDVLLGDDLDVPEDEAERREQLALNASSSAIGSVLIPFRGVVRAVTGAAKNERLAREAYERGLVRRAYLKGRGEVLDCDLS